MSVIRTGEALAPLAEGDPLPPHDVALPVSPSPIEPVFREARPRMLRFLARLSPNEDPEDLAQETFVRVLGTASASGRRISNLENYLFRVARNLTVENAKSASRQSRGPHVSLDEADIRAPDQVAALEARDMLGHLEAVMQRMKPRTREIFLAHRIDGYSYGEIASLTGLSVKGVEKHMSRAIAVIDRSMRHR